MNPISLSLLQEQFEGLAEEMGVALARSGFSPNIRVRRDFSCALFTAEGCLLAQAAHIPVHLGSMPAQVKRLVQTRRLAPGELYLGNDPFDGGTHLPDLTLLEPIFSSEQACLGIAAVRAHHADVGGPMPGSMSSQQSIHGEGLRIPLVKLRSGDLWNEDLLAVITANMRSPEDRKGDLLAQESACRIGRLGLQRIFDEWSNGKIGPWETGQKALLDSSEVRLRHELSQLMADKSTAVFEDLLETPEGHLSLKVRLELDEHGNLVADFSGTAASATSSFNATLAVTQAALVYATNCLLSSPHPINEGFLRCLKVRSTPGTVVHAAYPDPVAGGNVETSQRIVDLLFGALAQLLPQRIPAAAAGSMNNLSFGFDDGRVHYETSGGGYGGHPLGPGASGLQVHMTNTLSTPGEILEEEFPVLVLNHALRPDSGGRGLHAGGDGTVRHLRFLQSTHLSLLSSRRETTPYGLQDGEAGRAGDQEVRYPGQDAWTPLPACFSLRLPAGSEFRLKTPGGGGWGKARLEAKSPSRPREFPED